MTDYVVSDTTLTSVADAIREKGGTSAPLEWPQGYIDAVEDISTQPVSVPSKDVDFYDYDGTRVYSYTAAEFLALEEMPANPDHSHDEVPLTSQGWNWSFSDAQSYVANYGILDVGQLYVPTDGKTHIWIEIPPTAPTARRTFCLRYQQSISRGVTVDWGDGTLAQTGTDTTMTDRSHAYAAPGKYEITVYATSGMIAFGGENTYGMFGSNLDTDIWRLDYVKKIWFAQVTSIPTQSLIFCFALRELLLPPTITSIGELALRRVQRLPQLIYPHGITTNNIYSTNTANSTRFICASDTTLGNFHIANNKAERLIVPPGNTTIPQNAFQDNGSAHVAIIPNGVESIGQGAFYFGYGLLSLTIPATVTSIAENAFASCKGMASYHFQSATPPTLSNTNAFTGIPSDCIIYVPRGKLNTYKTATNWSTYASHMQEEPS